MHNQIVAYPAGECNANQSNPLFRSKPQISSVPGVLPKEPRRYRVSVDGQILAEKLTLDEALRVAMRGGAR